MPLTSKVLKSRFGRDEYMLFLTEDDHLETIIVFRGGSHVGEHITWFEIPGELRDMYEQHLDPQT